MSAKEKLEEIVESYNFLKKICDKAKERAKSDHSFVSEMGMIQSKKRKKIEKKEDIVDDYFDLLNEKITEHHIIELIATFEQIVFLRLDNAYGEIKRILSTEYEKRRKKSQNAPLYRCINSFIKNKEEIRNLGGAKNIIENQISPESFKELDEIIKYRNWLSHGKRWENKESGKTYMLTIEDINEIFLKIINEIG